MLSYIKSRYAGETGMSVSDDNSRLVQDINLAAKELYECTDLPGCLREVVLMVTANSIVSIPAQLGELRAVRGRTYKDQVFIRDMRPQYCFNAWPQIEHTWREMGPSPLMLDITNVAPFTYAVHAVETTPVVVYVTGKTTDSDKIVDTITMSATSVVGAVSFTEITSINKISPCTYNVTITDASSNVMATLYNNQLNTRYNLVDVSRLPNVWETTDGKRYVEVLYKALFTPFVDDSDEFLCEGFDDAIVYKCLEIWSAGQQGMEQRTLLYYRKCLQKLNERIEHVQGPIYKQMNFGERPMLNLIPRYRIMRRLPRVII